MKSFVSIFVLGFCCGLAFAKDLPVMQIKSDFIEPDFGFNKVPQKQHWQMGVY